MANNRGERTPPWRTPQTQKGVPISEFHTTEQDSPLNQLYKIRTRGKGTFLLINLARRPFNKTVSNALLASRKAQNTPSMDRPPGNRLPPALRAPELSQNAFLRALKTHLFSSARHSWDVLRRYSGAEYKCTDLGLLTYLLTDFFRRDISFLPLLLSTGVNSVQFGLDHSTTLALEPLSFQNAVWYLKSISSSITGRSYVLTKFSNVHKHQ